MLGIFGIGNPFRSDDGIGLFIIDLLERKYKDSSTVFFKIEIDVFNIEKYLGFNNYHKLLFIDAALSDQYPVGTILTSQLDNVRFSGRFATTTHNIGIIEYLQLLKNSQIIQLPAFITLLGIVIKDTRVKEGISNHLLERVPIVIQTIDEWIHEKSIPSLIQ